MKRLIPPDEVDRLLSREDEILPSSGFAASVMDAVRSEAAAPPPIAFPWKRALPGLVAGAIVLALTLAGLALLVTHPGSAVSASQVSTFSTPMPSPLTPLQRDLELAAMWTIASLFVAFVSVKLSMRLSSGGA